MLMIFLYNKFHTPHSNALTVNAIKPQHINSVGQLPYYHYIFPPQPPHRKKQGKEKRKGKNLNKCFIFTNIYYQMSFKGSVLMQASHTVG
jgi:hypothetical protein